MRRKDLAYKKVAILYFINSLNIPLTNAQITEFFVQQAIMHFFDVQQMLGELVVSEHLTYMEGHDYHFYSITDKGKEALVFFDPGIFDDVRDTITQYAQEQRARLINESQLKADYNKIRTDEYEVILKVSEQNINLMEIRLNVFSSDQAKIICANWRTKAPEVYKKIMEALTH